MFSNKFITIAMLIVVSLFSAAAIIGVALKIIFIPIIFVLSLDFIIFIGFLYTYRLFKELNNAIEKLEGENKKFSENNQELETNVKHFSEANKKLISIQSQTQKLLESLMVTGDQFQNFGTILEETTKKNLSLSDKLSHLLEKLCSKDFKDIDTNNDGIISKEEFTNYFTN